MDYDTNLLEVNSVPKIYVHSLPGQKYWNTIKYTHSICGIIVEIISWDRKLGLIYANMKNMDWHYL